MKWSASDPSRHREIITPARNLGRRIQAATFIGNKKVRAFVPCSREFVQNPHSQKFCSKKCQVKKANRKFAEK
jgi:hypothetical protein